MRLRMTTLPVASMPWAWKTCVARSRPTVVAWVMDGSYLSWSLIRPRPRYGTSMPESRGRPPHHIGIDRRHGLIRRWGVTDAARYDGALLSQLIDRNNTAGDVWADTAYRSRKNEKFLASRLLRSQIHRKKPKGAPMPRHTAHANARKSAMRSAVEHVFARQKGPMGLFVRTIGIARARTKIGLANLLYNMQRMVWLIEKATAT